MSQVSTARKYEERMATVVGGFRRTKKHYGDSEPDLESDILIGECKLRKSLGLETWMQQVEEHYKTGKICALFCKVKGLKDHQTIVCMRLGDFLPFIQMLGAGGDDGTDTSQDPDEE